jgi:hypothetical protein
MILKIERLWQFCLTFESWFCDLLWFCDLRISKIPLECYHFVVKLTFISSYWFFRWVITERQLGVAGNLNWAKRGVISPETTNLVSEKFDHSHFSSTIQNALCTYWNKTSTFFLLLEK